MTRVHLNTIRQVSDTFMQASEELVRKPLLCLLTQQIGTAQRSKEQEVPGKQSSWLGGAARSVEQNEGEVLGSVTRRMQRLDAYTADFDTVAILQSAMRHGIAVVFAFVVGAQRKLRTGRLCECSRAGREVRMDVGFENMRDLQALLGGVCDVAIDVADGIDDGSLTFV